MKGQQLSEKRVIGKLWVFRVVLIGLLYLSQPGSKAMAEDLKVEYFSHQHGLSQTNIIAIAQDPQGFMWFGTQDGLNRFDGYSFRVYKPDSNNPYAISNNGISSLLVDKQGQLWVGTTVGLNRYDFATERFEVFKHDPNNQQSLSHNTITALLQDSVGDIWVGTANGLNRLQPDAEVFTHYLQGSHDLNSISDNRINVIFQDADGDLWVGTDRGINRFDFKTQGFIRDLSLNNAESAALQNADILSIAQDKEGHIWIGTDAAGLYIYNKKQSLLRQYRPNSSLGEVISASKINAIYKNSKNQLWLATDGAGLNRYDDAQDRFIQYQGGPNSKDTLNDKIIFSLFEDQTGILWIGTYISGVAKLDTRKFSASLVAGQIGDNDGYSQTMLRAFLVDRHNVVWTGSSMEGIRVKHPDGSWQAFLHDPQDSYSLSNNNVFSIFEDADGDVWVGMANGRLNRYDRQSKRFIRYPSLNNRQETLRHGAIRKIIQGNNGLLWLALGTGGVASFNKATQEFEHFHHNPEDSRSISSNNVTSLFLNKAGTIWVSTYGGGLNLFDSQQGTFTHYALDSAEDRSRNEYLLFVSGDRNDENILWMSTSDRGFNRLDLTTGEFKNYNEQHGLPNITVYGILQDEQGFLWLTTNHGLSRFDPQTETFKNYDARDGLQSNEFNGNAAYRAPDGKLFVGGIHGYNAFYPDQIQDNTLEPAVYLTQLLLFNKPIKMGEEYNGRVLLPKSISKMDTLVLSYKESMVSFKFVALNYILPAKNQYAYKMDGLEEEWNVVGNQRFASYSALPPGDYVFRVKASNNDGVWNEAGASLAISITPPFWQTWWFRFMLLVLVILIIFAIYRVRIKSIKALNKRLKNEVKLRTMELEGQKEDLEAALTELNETKDAFKESSQVATGVLHNVGNLLNSVNTSASVIQDKLESSVLARYLKANEMLRGNIDDIENFIQNDSRGKKLLNYYLEIETPLLKEKEGLMENTKRLIGKIAAIKEAITAQQRSAKGQGFVEALSLETLIDDTITLQRGNILPDDIQVVKRFDPLPEVKVEKAKLVQILFNLYKNARESMDEAKPEEKIITIELSQDEENAYIKVTDTGLGIAADKLKNMFSYGFTTKSEGHGFGLHSCYNYMTGMGGKMMVESDGLGKGATFILQLPLQGAPAKPEDEPTASLKVVGGH